MTWQPNPGGDLLVSLLWREGIAANHLPAVRRVVVYGLGCGNVPRLTLSTSTGPDGRCWLRRDLDDPEPERRRFVGAGWEGRAAMSAARWVRRLER